MSYISAIIVDFGSSNSGCARIELEKGKPSYTLPVFLQGSQYYAKDETWFYVHPMLWERIMTNYASLSDDDFKIRSRVLPRTECPTVIWGRQHIWANAALIENEGWIGFKHFKMNLYRQEDYLTNGVEVPIKEVVRIFLRILKIECLMFEKDRRHRIVDREEIQWGVTIPTIWTDAEKALMTEVASDVFGNHVRILSEPEGPILSELLHSQGDGCFSLKQGRVSLVVDLGGGTTDITLMEEVSEDPACEYPLKVIASTDGVGVGGNNIDEAFWNYLLRLLSQGRTDDGGMKYDSLTDKELKECLLVPFMSNVRDYIEMENEWLRFKHKESSKINFPPAYRMWLKAHGHSQIVTYLTDLMVGNTEIEVSDLRKKVFEPTFERICRKIETFLKGNIDKIPANQQMFFLIKAGGLSLSTELRDRIDAIVAGLNLQYTTNLSFAPVSTSGSIMDGACIVLLNRKIINRKASCNIFYDMGTDLFFLKKSYAHFGVDITLGQLNEIFEEDKNAGAVVGEKAVPVAIEGHYFKDHESLFYPRNKEQDSIPFTFYGTVGKYIVLPSNNPKCFVLGARNFETKHHMSFKLIVDFNESPLNNNFHYYVMEKDSGEIMDEANISIAPNNKNQVI